MIVTHGYQPTDVRCPYCGDSYGMRERNEDGTVTYRCWCGAKARISDEVDGVQP